MEVNKRRFIEVRGARVHNLRNVNIKIPQKSFTVITGPSGSGKSSLAFDTIYAEGQRRYVESLSAYARQFIDKTPKPEVDAIEGLSPTISIEQKTTSYNPRSTVGTVTEVYDYLRLLFARISTPYCWSCGDEIKSQSPQQMSDTILTMEDGAKLAILAPIVRERKGEYYKELNQLRRQGFIRVRIDGETFDLSEDINLDKKKKHTIEVYVDRIVIKGDRNVLSTRVSDSVELGLKLGNGLIVLETKDGEHLLSQKFACLKCNVNYPEPEPRSFSFNSPAGACPKCDGIGTLKPIEDDIDPADAEEFLKSREYTPCPSCDGTRLRKESLNFRINGKNIAEMSSVSLTALRKAMDYFQLTDREKAIGDRILKEIKERLDFLVNVGVGYLSLSRSAKTLSGGEAQRIRLATQIGSALIGVTYVLDEPSIGLHPRDHHRLLETLERLRNLGNSVIVVEHDRETIEMADYLVDLGPGAGVRGGEIVSHGVLKDVRNDPKSLTGQYLKGKLKIELPETRRPINPMKMLELKGVTLNNIHGLNVGFPLGVFTCVTGISGSGKSSLIVETLYPALLKHTLKIKKGTISVDEVKGLEHIDKVIDINQKPIGRTPRSNPATYTGLFGIIRDLFASLPEAQVRGYKPGRFSFNVKGGRCDACDGDGVKRIEMHFLPDVYVVCDECHGSRYNRETEEVKYKEKSVADVLRMTVSEAYEFFDAIPSLKIKLKILNDVGLGYITLGQNATTLSGGEAQRIKLAKELSRRSTGKTIYILDEPTTGLHFDDIKKLIKMLDSLVDHGNTVIVIEHCLDLIKVADYIIDMGPEGGERGGKIVAAGTPEDVAKTKGSHTGQYLKPYLEG